MGKIRSLIAGTVLALAGTFVGLELNAALPAAVDGQPVPSLAPLVKKASPAVVNIATRGTVDAPRNPLMDDPFFQRFFGMPEQRQRQREVRSAGSGVIVDAKDGLVITNHHVVEKADEIEVFLDDGRSLEAEIVGSDAGTDIAVLRLADTSDLTEMSLGDSDELEVGDFVVAIGNPFGLAHTVTSGIVSAKGRSGLSRDGYEDFIQTDASINPGNSGGALIDLNGNLVGINAAIFSGSGGNIGIGFAIPVNIARSITDQIVEFGEIRRGLLGVSISDFNAETAEAFGMEASMEGALVQEVVQGSAAEKAGIEVGDVIVQVDDAEITSAADLRTTIGLSRSGETVRLTIYRDGKERKISAVLDEMSGSVQVAAADIHPGLAGADFSDYMGGDEGFDGKGVVVDAVAAGSPAAARGIKPGDIIVAVNRARVESVAEMQEEAEGRNLLLLEMRRGSRNLLLQIR